MCVCVRQLKSLNQDSGILSPNPRFFRHHPVAQAVENLPAVQETQVWSLGGEDPLEEMEAHSSILAQEISQTEGPDGLQFMESQSRTEATNTHTVSLSVSAFERERPSPKVLPKMSSVDSRDTIWLHPWWNTHLATPYFQTLLFCWSVDFSLPFPSFWKTN